MNEILALIPARSGSKGLVNKNILKLGGSSLLEWSIKACKRSKMIERIIVSTDSEEYADHAKYLGAECPFIRPKEISGDHSTDLDFVKHLLDRLDNDRKYPELIVHIRPTTPFRNPKVVDKAIKIFKKNHKATALRSVHEMSESAYKCFELGVAGNLSSFLSRNQSLDIANNARQTFPKTYSANGYVDVLRTSMIKEKNQLHGDFVVPFITEIVTEVDTQSDFEFLKFQLSRDKKIRTRIFG